MNLNLFFFNIHHGNSLDTGGVWTSGNDMVQEGTFVWHDGFPVNFNVTRSTIVSNFYHCVSLSLNGDFVEKACGTYLNFICESDTMTGE